MTNQKACSQYFSMAHELQSLFNKFDLDCTVPDDNNLTWIIKHCNEMKGVLKNV